MRVVEVEDCSLEAWGCRGHNLREVGGADAALGAIDGIGSDEHLGLVGVPCLSGEHEVATIVGRYLQDDISAALLDIAQSFGIGCLLASEEEIAAGLYAMQELLTGGGTIVVHDVHADVLYLLVHHPRHDAHHHDGEDEDDFGHEGVAANLQEFLPDEVFDHGKGTVYMF